MDEILVSVTIGCTTAFEGSEDGVNRFMGLKFIIQLEIGNV